MKSRGTLTSRGTVANEIPSKLSPRCARLRIRVQLAIPFATQPLLRQILIGFASCTRRVPTNWR